jgi:hypothetical protein
MSAFQDKLYERFKAFIHPENRDTSLMRFGIGPEGWNQIVWEACESFESLNLPDFEVVQIKEKFAQLRIYVHGETEDVRRIIQVAEAKADRTCQLCGKPGLPRKKQSGWLWTACDDCVSKP